MSDVARPHPSHRPVERRDAPVRPPGCARRRGSGSTSRHRGRDRSARRPNKAVFFAADGLRQDLVEKYAAQGVMPTMARVPQARRVRDRRRPPDPGAAEHGRRLVHAWRPARGRASTARRTTRSTSTASRSRNRTAAFDPNVLQAESIAQSAERGGLKVAQVEWAGGRNATIQGPTIDFQSFFSGRGVATNFIGAAGEPLFDDAPFIAAFGLQFDHPPATRVSRRSPAPHRRRPPAGPARCRPRSARPMEMRLRVLDFGVDKYGLNAWIFDSTNDGTTNYDKVLFSRTKSAADSVGILAEGPVGPTSRSRSSGGALAGLTAGMLVKVEELTGDLSRVRLFHTSVSRALATWPGSVSRASPATSPSTSPRSSRRRPPPTSRSSRPASRARRPTSSRASTGRPAHLPMLEYVANKYKPDLLLVGMPTTDEFQHQFLGLVSPKLPGGAANPAYDDVDLNGVPDGRVAAAREASSGPPTRRPTRR